MMRTGFSRGGTKPPRAKAALMILGSLSVLAFMAAGAYLNRAPALDATTLCPSDQALTTSVVVLVDTTDPLDQTQAARLLATVRRVRETLPTFGKLTLLFLDANTPYEPKELVSLCNPGSPRGVNPLFQTESRVAKRWNESFGAPIDQAVSQLLLAPTAKQSPIIEAITAATWRPDFDSRTTSWRRSSFPTCWKTIRVITPTTLIPICGGPSSGPSSSRRPTRTLVLLTSRSNTCGDPPREQLRAKRTGHFGDGG